MLRDRLFRRKSGQAIDPQTPQLELFNEPENVVIPVSEELDEEVVPPTKRGGKRKPPPAELPHIEVIHQFPRHGLIDVVHG